MSMVPYTALRTIVEVYEKNHPETVVGALGGIFGNVFAKQLGKKLATGASKKFGEKLATTVAKRISTKAGAKIAGRSAVKSINKSAKLFPENVSKITGKSATKTAKEEWGQVFLKDLEEQGIIQAGKRTAGAAVGRKIVKAGAIGGLALGAYFLANKLLFKDAGTPEEEAAAATDSGLPAGDWSGDTGGSPYDGGGGDTGGGGGATSPGGPGGGLPGMPTYDDLPAIATPMQGSPMQQGAGYNPWFLTGFSNGIVAYI